MKDLLVFGIDFLLVILLINIALNGLVIGKVEILSVTQIQEKNAEVTEAIEHSNKIQDQYKSSFQGLTYAKESVDQSAKIYEETYNGSSNQVKQAASSQNLYDIEYIWAEIGKIATKNDLSLKISIEPTGVDSINTLKIKVMGQYRGITQFMSEFDRDQDFRVEDFNLFIYEQKPVTVVSKGGSVDKWLLQTIGATFTIKNVAIKQETLSKEFTGTTYEIEAGEEYQGFVKALDQNVVNGTTTGNATTNATTANSTNTATTNSTNTATANSTNEAATNTTITEKTNAAN